MRAAGEARSEPRGTYDRELNQAVEYMRLTLFYRGPLHAATPDNPRAEEKQKIRRYFHKELADLWETHPAVEGQIEKWRALPADQQARNGANAFITVFDSGLFRFVPLVVKRHWMRCELDILFLRHEPPGTMFNRETGDLDNRLKVLFDALRMPKPNSQEIVATDQPSESERPFFCLLEDDVLITRVNLETDRLLDKQMETDSEVELVIRVTIKVTRLTYGNMALGG
jgi:hypothetical protein